jgi:hypothetical protein
MRGDCRCACQIKRVADVVPVPHGKGEAAGRKVACELLGKEGRPVRSLSRGIAAEESDRNACIGKGDRKEAAAGRGGSRV